LTGQHCPASFIAGASRGIGAAAARLFAQEGAAVVLGARSADALDKVVAEVRADGGVADAVALDLADRASIQAAVDRVEELHGRLDGAFNNGAAGQQPGPLRRRVGQRVPPGAPGKPVQGAACTGREARPVQDNAGSVDRARPPAGRPRCPWSSRLVPARPAGRWPARRRRGRLRPAA